MASVTKTINLDDESEKTDAMSTDQDDQQHLITSLESDIRRVDELRKRKLDVHKIKDELLSQGALQHQTQLTRLKSQFNDSKHFLTGIDTKMVMLKVITESNVEDWISPVDIDPMLKEMGKKVQDIKSQIDDAILNMSDMMESATQNELEQDEKMKTLAATLERVQDKKLKVDALEERKKKKLDENASLGDLQKNIDSMECKKRQLETTLAASKKNALEHTQHIGTLKQAKEKCQETVDRMAELQDTFKQIQHKSQEANQHAKKGLEEAIEVVACWSGFAEHSISENSISLEYLTTDGPKLLLTLEFRISATGEALLIDAKVNVDSFDIRDLVAVAVEKNDIRYLIQQVRQRWQSHIPLHNEVAELQSQYAMDWEPASSAIRLIVGGQGHIVCTLRVEPGYPESGAVKLEGITGATEDMDMANIKPNEESCSLKTWFQYLTKHFQS